MKIRPRFAHPIARWLRVSAIVLYPYVFFSEARERVTDSVFRHEMIHVRQIRRIGPLRFYVQYFVEFAVFFVRHRNVMSAYLSISFEREAYASQDQVTLTLHEAAEIKQYT
jgi:hypothetical protein